MKTLAKFAAALVLGTAALATLSVAPIARAADDEKKDSKAPTLSKADGKQLKAAHDALDAKKYQDAIAKLKEVEALPNRPAYDTHVMNELFGVAYVRLMNYAEAAKYLEPGVTDGFLDAKDVNTRIKALAQLNYQLKNYDKAIDYGNRAVKGGFADDDMYVLVSQAYYLKPDYKGTIKFTDPYIDSLAKQGKMPKEELLQLVLSSCTKLEDSNCQTRALERMVQYYPKQEYWQNLLDSLFRNKDATSNDKTMLNIYRLAADVDAMKRPEEYTEMAQLAIDAGSPGEAQRILEKGFAKNVFTEQRDKERNTRLLEAAKKQAAADQASLTKIAGDASGAKTGDKDVGLGLAYLSYQQYDKAVAALNDGIAKGGLRNEAEARLLLGIAQLKAGKADDATKTFHSVKGDPTLERLANLWTLHARQA